MMSISEYVESRLGVELHPNKSGYVALCPWHNERTPSFQIRCYEDGRQDARCFSPACGHWAYDVVGILRWLPPEEGGFAHIESKREAYFLAHRQAEALGLARPGEAPQQRAVTNHTPKIILARRRHRIAMTELLKAASDCLMSPEGISGRAYLTEGRKLIGPYLSTILPTLGYVPHSFDFHQKIMDRLRELFNGEAGKIGQEIGLLNDEFKPQLWNRILFPVYEGREVIWYEGRTASLGGNKRYRFLDPPHLSPQFYMPLSAHIAQLPGTHLVEGPTDAFAYAVVGLFSFALMGAKNIPSIERLRQLPQPLWLALDNRTSDKAGAAARDKVIANCTAGNIPYYDTNLFSFKDPASWLESVGPDRFFAAQAEEYHTWLTQHPEPLSRKPLLIQQLA